MYLDKLNLFLNAFPDYRRQQVYRAIFYDLIDNWQLATTLPKKMRYELQPNYPLAIQAKLISSQKNQTIKALITLTDGNLIETVLMQHHKRNTVCVSTQVGCALGCRFCATGHLGFRRNLTADEMVMQVLFFARYLKNQRQRVTNIVFMGMGEPFLNYDELFKAIRFLNSQQSFNIAARKISISTAGIIEGIEYLKHEKLQVNLAISLHAPNNHLRNKLMPINRRYPLSQLLIATENYIRFTKRKVMFEYLLIKDINDKPAHAYQLIKLMSKPLHVVNLIPYNPTGFFRPSPSVTVKKFRKILAGAGIEVTQRYEHGQDVQAACGQLVADKNIY